MKEILLSTLLPALSSAPAADVVLDCGKAVDQSSFFKGIISTTKMFHRNQWVGQPF